VSWYLGGMNDDTQPMTLRLPRSQYERLRREAFEGHVKMSDLVREGIELRLGANPKSATERAVWAVWNALPDGATSPVRRIARALDMTPADVAFIVFPAETFGRWDDSQEPDLP
jgi:hypothetical protein